MTDEEIPLDITGHDDREARPSDAPRNDRTGSEATREEPGERSDETGRSLPDGGTSIVDGSDQGGPGGPPGPEAPGEDEVEPVEVLVQLAEEGEIDPWDIDVVRVTDKFLKRIDEADLRTSGRALFYASVLVRMKSDAMLEDDEPDEPDAPFDAADPWEEPLGDDELGVDPFDQLDAEMDRRLERKRARGMPETLDELVRELRDAERGNWWKESREYDTSDSPSGYQRGTQELDYRSADDLRMDDEPSAADVTGTAHAENIDQIIADVEAAVRQHYHEGRAEVLYREVATSGGSRVETFLGLLFLSHRGEVVLQQDDLFGDLWIRDPEADLEPEATAAD